MVISWYFDLYYMLCCMFYKIVHDMQYVSMCHYLFWNPIFAVSHTDMPGSYLRICCRLLTLYGRIVKSVLGSFDLVKISKKKLTWKLLEIPYNWFQLKIFFLLEKNLVKISSDSVWQGCPEFTGEFWLSTNF